MLQVEICQISVRRKKEAQESKENRRFCERESEGERESVGYLRFLKFTRASKQFSIC